MSEKFSGEAEKAARNLEMVNDNTNGMFVRALAEKYGVSRQRVRTILKRHDEYLVRKYERNVELVSALMRGESGESVARRMRLSMPDVLRLEKFYTGKVNRGCLTHANAATDTAQSVAGGVQSVTSV